MVHPLCTRHAGRSCSHPVHMQSITCGSPPLGMAAENIILQQHMMSFSHQPFMRPIQNRNPACRTFRQK